MPDCQTCHKPLVLFTVEPTTFNDTGVRLKHRNPTEKVRCQFIASKPMARTFFDPVRNRYVRRASKW